MGKTFNMTGGSGGGGGGGITLSSIAITTPPTKTAYQVGESFDPTGMVVTATYSNGATLAVGGYTVSPATFAYGDTEATITYTEGGVSKTATQAVTVNKLTPTITASPSAVTLDADHLTATVALSSPSSGAFSASSSDATVATVSVSGNTLTVSSVNDTTGTATITVTQAATSEYESATATVGVTATFGILPSGYTELSYIENAYNAPNAINTHVHFPSAGNKIKATIMPIETTGVDWVGVQSGSLFCMVRDYAASNTIYVYPGNRKYFAGASGIFARNTKYDIEITMGDPVLLKVGDTSYSLTGTTSPSYVEGIPDADMYIFAMNVNSEISTERFGGRIYRFEVLDANDAQLCCLIPARRNSDNAVGMYDTVAGAFRENIGTGSFTAGPAAAA